ncbi:hypothetical protein MMC08_002055 [Hypocenomyce scalaris]|nr:hypothetical protein [Hypocenomyce scalaris]
MNAEKKDLEAGAEAPLPQPGLGEADADRRAASATPPSEKRDEEPVKDPNLVTWDGPDDPLNPRNWTHREKWSATLLVSAFAFITPISSSMVAPALKDIAAEFDITSAVVENLLLSVFVLGYAFGPLLFGPLSEIYGRVHILQLANLMYLVFNLAAGASRNTGEMVAFRFLAGFGGAAPLALGNGVLADCWSPEERAMSVAIYTLAPLLGPAIGPVMGGFITQHTSWRWAFWATSIADGGIQLLGVLLLRESWAPKILHQKMKKLQKDTGNQELHTEHDETDVLRHLKTSVIRPLILLGTQPIVQVLALYMAYLFGIMYLVLTSFPTLWGTYYGETTEIGGLNYIALGIGLTLGTQVTARTNSIIYRKLKEKNHVDVGSPEYRIPMMFIGALLPPIGLLWYGWSAQARVHWIMPELGRR